MTNPDSDETVRLLRSAISEVDRTIVDAINARIELVTRLKRYKDSCGLPFVDPEREQQLVDELERKNPGPLTAAGLRELYERVLELTKREVTRDSEE